MTDEAAVAIHEAGHAVAARRLGVQVMRATARPGEAAVRTRYRTNGIMAMARLTALVIVDLAGAAAERRRDAGTLAAAAWEFDEQNALGHAMRVTMYQEEELTDALRAEAAALVERLRPKAAALVEKNWPAIERVAAALAAGAVLDQASIDALVAAAAPTSR